MLTSAHNAQSNNDPYLSPKKIESISYKNDITKRYIYTPQKEITLKLAAYNIG